MVGTDIKSNLKRAVDAALAESNPDKADQLYIDVLQLVRLQVGDKETDLANALQSIAKDLEAEGRKQHAFDFKQKTCILLLEWTMSPMPALPSEPMLMAPAQTKQAVLNQLMSVHTVPDLEVAKHHYENLLGSTILDESDEGLSLRTAYGDMIVLTKGTAPGQFPVYQASQTGQGQTLLQADGWSAERGKSIMTPSGKARVYSHPQLGQLALIE